MGSDRYYAEEAPAHWVTVSCFWIDRIPVTKRQFRKFVEATGYVPVAIVAEIAPDPGDYPGALADMLKPGSLVFAPPHGAVTRRMRRWRAASPKVGAAEARKAAITYAAWEPTFPVRSSKAARISARPNYCRRCRPAAPHATDADTGVWKWRIKTNYPIMAGVTPTAGGLVFFADMGGNFYAVDAATGQKLWGQNLGGAIAGEVITYIVSGKQYVAAAAGFISPAWPVPIRTSKVVILGLDNTSASQ